MPMHMLGASTYTYTYHVITIPIPISISIQVSLVHPNVTADSIRHEVEQVLKQQPLVTKVEYISVASHYNMQELHGVHTTDGAVLSSAVRLGSVRLIDNLLLGPAYKAIVN
ncbi:hypothetical protein EON63_19340 [archaeon]|nr:MAG: hypothetical protein EON63_19340 [archaeon]